MVEWIENGLDPEVERSMRRAANMEAVKQQMTPVLVAIRALKVAAQAREEAREQPPPYRMTALKYAEFIAHQQWIYDSEADERREDDARMAVNLALMSPEQRARFEAQNERVMRALTEEMAKIEAEKTPEQRQQEERARLSSREAQALVETLEPVDYAEMERRRVNDVD
jgi:hypothetical protein